MESINRFKVSNDLSENYTINVVERTSRDVPNHWHDFYEIDICLGGSGTTSINGKTYPVSRGYISFLTPSDFHSYSVDEELKLLNFTFTPNCIDHSDFSELLELTKCSYGFVRSKELERICSFINTIKAEVLENKLLSKKYISHVLSCILIDLIRLRPEPAKDDTKISYPVRKMIFYVNTHFKDDISLDSLSEFTGFSPGYICKIFPKVFGCSFKEMLTELRLKYAENLLMHSSESITNISYFSGFQTISTFSRAFRRKHKTSPGSFRKNNAVE